MDLDGEQTPSNTPAFVAIGCVFFALVATCLLWALLAQVPHHHHSGNGAAIGALKAISNAQILYREGDKDGDGTLQYSSNLRALTNTGPSGTEDLIDEVLASGTKQGYVFAITSASEFGFTVNADPLEPGETGDRYFGANMKGEIYYSKTGPVRWNQDGSSPDPQLGR